VVDCDKRGVSPLWRKEEKKRALGVALRATNIACCISRQRRQHQMLSYNAASNISGPGWRVGVKAHQAWFHQYKRAFVQRARQGGVSACGISLAAKAAAW